ncbi:hypothetical protein [Haloarchaeobius baliensis]|uniref:hypothetical protein n=1 Tax=Haloarchaeobius baliensis TaxID=1670458 RepID=UPI003F884F14
MTDKLNVSDIRRIVVKDIAMGIDSQPTQPEVRYYLRRGQYVIQDVGSKGYDLTVWNDDGFKMRVIAVADTDVEPQTSVVRGGSL